MRTAGRLKVLFIWVGVLCVFLSGSMRAQTVTTVYVFNNTTNGDGPNAVLVQGRDGNLYGSTDEGGTSNCTYNGYTIGCGTIFKLDTSGNLTTLHDFTGPDGALPEGIILGADGNFYGSALNGGNNGFGTFFKITASGVFTKLHDFANGTDGEYPINQLLAATDGNLYGFTETGLYRATTSGTVTQLFTFSPNPITNNFAPLIQATNGYLYATLPYGYCNGNTCPCGAFVKLSLQGTRISEHDFGCHSVTVGNSPFSALIQAEDGNFYGTNVNGGTGGGARGTAFKLDEITGIVTVLHDYDENSGFPFTGLTQGTDGNFYGVVIESNLSASGAAFELTPSGVYNELAGLPYEGEDFPYWSLLQHTDGKFYGSSWFTEDVSNYYGSVYAVDNNLGPFITFVAPQGRVGSRAQILGQGLTGATSVTFNGLATTSFTVVSDTFMTAVVPVGATSGAVVVTAPSGTLTSNKSFRVSAW